MAENQHQKKTNGSQSFDWNELQSSIMDIAQSMSEGEDSTLDLLEKIWADRAANLARIAEKEDQGHHLELVLVRLGREIYGFDVRHVSDIRTARQITRVPRLPAWVSGVVNVRGRILSAVDLRLYLGLPEACPEGKPNPERTRHLLVVESSPMELALLVDEVLAVHTLPSRSIQDPSGTVRGIAPAYVKGIGAVSHEIASAYQDTPVQPNGKNVAGHADPEELLVVLDLAAILADPHLIIREELL